MNEYLTTHYPSHYMEALEAIEDNDFRKFEKIMIFYEIDKEDFYLFLQELNEDCSND